MEVMAIYTARVTRDEDAWSVEVPEVARTTQALRLRDVEPMARDLIAIMEDVAADSFELNVEWPTEISDPITRHRGLLAQAEEIRAAAARLQREIVLDMRNRGSSVRDIAAVLGVSFQRVQQLVSPPTAAQAGASNAAKKLPVKKAPAKKLVVRKSAPTKIAAKKVPAKKVSGKRSLEGRR